MLSLMPSRKIFGTVLDVKMDHNRKRVMLPGQCLNSEVVLIFRVEDFLGALTVSLRHLAF